jgi:hypothetical protein
MDVTTAGKRLDAMTQAHCPILPERRIATASRTYPGVARHHTQSLAVTSDLAIVTTRTGHPPERHIDTVVTV